MQRFSTAKRVTHQTMLVQTKKIKTLHEFFLSPKCFYSRGINAEIVLKIVQMNTQRNCWTPALLVEPFHVGPTLTSHLRVSFVIRLQTLNTGPVNKIQIDGLHAERLQRSKVSCSTLATSVIFRSLRITQRKPFSPQSIQQKMRRSHARNHFQLNLK